VFMARKNPKNTTSLIVYDDNSKGFRDVIVPQSIAVINKTQVARDENCLLFLYHSTPNGCRCTSVNPAGATITEHFNIRMPIKQLRVTNSRTIPQLQHCIGWH